MSVVNTYQILLMSRRSSHRMGLLCALTLSSAALGSIPATLSFSPCTMTTCQTWSTHKDVPRTRSRRRRRPREVVEPPRCSPSASGSTSSSSGAGGRDEGNTGWPFIAGVRSGTSTSKSTHDVHERSLPSTHVSENTRGNANGSRHGDASFVFAPAPLAPERTPRRMQVEDVDGVVALAFEEYCENSADFLKAIAVEDGCGGAEGVLGATWEWANDKGFLDQADADRLVDWLEMMWLRAMIRWGFSMRIAIGEGGQDHKVFCVCDDDPSGTRAAGTSLLAFAEVSLQIPNGKTAPPIPLPMWLKKLRGWPIPVAPYISNVLVNPDARRQGLAKMLMARCEKQAREWGHSEVFLHVDLNYWPAVHLYESLGYEAVGEPMRVEPFKESMDAPRLRFMKKLLT